MKGAVWIFVALVMGYVLGVNNQSKSNRNEFESSIDNGDLFDLDYIQFEPLVISYTDDECGEWGGNTEVINIQREHVSNKLSALYTYDKIDCATSYSAISNITNRKRVELNKRQEILVVELIVELIKSKLRRENVPSHSGAYNSIILRDSSILISDYPSIKLNSFTKLKNEILRDS